MMVTIAALMVIIVLLIVFWEIWKIIGVVVGAILYFMFTLIALALTGYAIYLLVTTETVFADIWGMFVPFGIAVVLTNAYEWYEKAKFGA